MKKLLVLLFCSFLLISGLEAQTLLQKMYVDFGPAASPGLNTASPDVNGNTWNNHTGITAGTTTALVNSSGTATGFSLVNVTACLANGGSSVGGLVAPSASLLGDFAIANATQDYFFTQSGLNGTNSFSIKLTGLSKTKGYKFYLFGTRDNTSIRITQYNITGAVVTTGTLQTSGTGVGANSANGNNNNIYTTPILYSDANAEIKIEVGYTTGGYGYLGVMKVEEYSAPYVNVTGISVSGNPVTTDRGTSQMTATVTPANASVATVTWSVSDPTIATISSTGLLSALKNGTVTVTATSNEPSSTVSGSTQISVSNQLTRYPVTFKIVDQTKTITNGTGSNAGTNVVMSISSTLQTQNPRNPNPTDWWYPMYADATYSPKGIYTNNTYDYTWQTTLYAAPGTYTWTPYLKSTGWTYLNNTYVYSATSPVISFTVNADGTISGKTEVVIPNVKYKIRLKVIDKTKGALSSSTVYPDNNVVAWLSGGLNATSSWFYGFYSGDALYPNGSLIKNDTAWVWQASFDAPPGNYQWNPSMKSLGTSAANPVTINGNVSNVTWVGSNLSFAVGQTGALSGDTVLILAEDPLNPIKKTYLTLNVDMKGLTIDPAGVFVTGTFNNWSSTATQMVDPDADGIYTKNIEVTKSNIPYEYKFINGNTWSNVEVVFGECEFRSNRFMLVDTGSVVVPAVAYGYCGAVPAEISKIRVACIGSSTTQGAGTSSQLYKSWPIQIRTNLGSAYYTENLGVSGTTMQNIAGQAWTETNQYNYAKLLNPNIVLMALGGNDTKLFNWDATRFRSDYINRIAEFKALPTHPEVYMCMPGKIRPNSYGLNDSVMINYELPIVRDISKTYMIPVIDYNTVTSPLAVASYFPDGVHGNDDGAKLIADKIAEVLLTPKPVISLETAGSYTYRTFYEHRWYLNGTLIENSNNQTITATQSGVYNVAVKISSTEDHVLVSQPYTVQLSPGESVALTTKTSVTATANTLEVEPSIYCDSSTKKLVVQHAEKSTLVIYSTNGITVKKIDVTSNNFSIDMSGLSRGVYFCKLEARAKVITNKVML